MKRNDWHRRFSSHDIPRPRHELQPKANEYSWQKAWCVRFPMHSCETKAGELSLFSLQYHLQRLSKLIPFWQNAFPLSMSKESYSLQQRPTLFRLQSNLFLHLNDLPVSLQALQHLQCYIRLKIKTVLFKTFTGLTYSVEFARGQPHWGTRKNRKILSVCHV